MVAKSTDQPGVLKPHRCWQCGTYSTFRGNRSMSSQNWCEPCYGRAMHGHRVDQAFLPAERISGVSRHLAHNANLHAQAVERRAKKEQVAAALQARRKWTRPMERQIASDAKNGDLCQHVELLNATPTRQNIDLGTKINDYYRQQERLARAVNRGLEDVEEPTSEPEAVITRAHYADLAAQAYRLMSPTERDVLNLAAVYELTSQEVATALNLTRDYVITTLRRLRDNLGTRISPT